MPAPLTEKSPSRYSHLDAVRGLAALVVVLHHCLLTFPQWQKAYDHGPAGLAEGLLTYSPLHLFWAGHVAVVIFFVLSGFVLALMLLRTPPISYGTFVGKRICRIYLPFVVVVAIAMALMQSTSPHGIPELSEWFNGSWSGGISGSLILNHLLMLGRYRYNYVDNPVWSLVHEMRYSLVFPVILWMARRVPARVLLPAAMIVSLGFRGGLMVWRDNTLLESLSYLFVFLAGATLAVHRGAAQDWYRRQPAWIRIGLAVLAILLLSTDGFRFVESKWVKAGLMIATHSASVLLLLCVLSAKSGRAFLEWPLFQWLGRISYSLYLSHLVLLLTLIYVLRRVAAAEVVVVAVPVVAVLVATLLFRFLEQPSMKLGQKLQGRMDGKASRA